MVITCSNKKCVVVSALHSFTGVSSSHIVKYSFKVMIYLAPYLLVGGLIGPKSLFPIFQILAESLVVSEASHIFF
jgi:hypothetical protein